MKKQSGGMTKKREKQLKAKYAAGTLTREERDEWWPYRLKQMRDEYHGRKR